MTEQSTTSNSAPAEVVFNVQRIYLKDLSLELPHAPAIFLEQEPPHVDVALNVGHQHLSDIFFEVALTATVTTRIKTDKTDKVVYLVEAKQAGIFEIANLPQDHLERMLNIYCANILYSYLCSNVADAISRSSLPALHMNPVNFEALFEQRLQHEATSTETASAPTTAPVIMAPVSTTKQ